MSIPSLTAWPRGKDKSTIIRLCIESFFGRVMIGEDFVQGWKGGAVKGPTRAL